MLGPQNGAVEVTIGSSSRRAIFEETWRVPKATLGELLVVVESSYACVL